MTMQTCDNPQQTRIHPCQPIWNFLRRAGWLALSGIGSLLMFSASASSNPSVVLHLPNGDRVTGVIVSSNAEGLVLTTAWGGNVTVPTAQIISRTQSSDAPTGTNIATATAIM